MLRYILFHHQTTTLVAVRRPRKCCVISSFITKPQPKPHTRMRKGSCVISSFITKPQPTQVAVRMRYVALYPLSSPNHNLFVLDVVYEPLRYILFHHQTTTLFGLLLTVAGCVISSFITKPQRCSVVRQTRDVALYPLSSPNHNLTLIHSNTRYVALYPLSSPNHNHFEVTLHYSALRYILFHHQTTTSCLC